MIEFQTLLNVKILGQIESHGIMIKVLIFLNITIQGSLKK